MAAKHAVWLDAALAGVLKWCHDSIAPAVFSTCDACFVVNFKAASHG